MWYENKDNFKSEINSQQKERTFGNGWKEIVDKFVTKEFERLFYCSSISEKENAIYMSINA